MYEHIHIDLKSDELTFTINELREIRIDFYKKDYIYDKSINKHCMLRKSKNK